MIERTTQIPTGEISSGWPPTTPGSGGFPYQQPYTQQPYIQGRVSLGKPPCFVSKCDECSYKDKCKNKE